MTNNTWTLIKHVGGSVNKGAAKIDRVVYGPVTNKPVAIISVPPKETHPVRDVFIGIGIFILIIVVFVGYVSGHVKGRDIIGL